MNRDALRPLALALLALLAVSMVSATVANVDEPTGGSGGGDGDGAPGGSGGGGVVPDENPEGQPISIFDGSAANGQLCVTGLDSLWVQLGLVAALALLFVAVWYRSDVVASAVLVGVVALPLGLLYVVLSCNGAESELPDQAATGADGMSEAGGASQGGGVPETMFNAPLWVIVLVGAVAVAVTLVTVSRAGGVRELVGSVRAEDDEPGESAGRNAAAVGRVAGRAADRIETGADADNEVFRAWTSMTEHLAVDRPASSTPREFADAAVAAGFDRADVTELTDLFAAVRYGGEDPTDDRERRAVAALRRIEAASEASDEDRDGHTDGGSDERGAD